MVDGPEGPNPLDEQAGGVTRREALKRGALLGGALVWATPAVQVIGMKPAFAQSVSAPCQFELFPVPQTSPPSPAIACFTYQQSVCDCVEEAEANNDLIARAICFTLPGSDPIAVDAGPC